MKKGEPLLWILLFAGIYLLYRSLSNVSSYITNLPGSLTNGAGTALSTLGSEVTSTANSLLNPDNIFGTVGSSAYNGASQAWNALTSPFTLSGSSIPTDTQNAIDNILGPADVGSNLELAPSVLSSGLTLRDPLPDVAPGSDDSGFFASLMQDWQNTIPADLSPTSIVTVPYDGSGGGSNFLNDPGSSIFDNLYSSGSDDPYSLSDLYGSSSGY